METAISPKIKVAIVGLGARGKDTYAPYAEKFPDKVEITAIADVVREKVDYVAQRYHVPIQNCFSSAEKLLQAPKLADVLLVCTQDRQHVSQAIAAIQKGYHVLLEKPISPSERECLEVVQAAHTYQRQVAVCHVLRYTVFYQKIKELIDSGRIGKVVSIHAMENVCWWHQAHSFVRGNWRDAEETSPMILAKSCHDMDIIRWLMGKKCVRVSSFGSLMHFRSENAPEGSADRCLNGCKVQKDCPYDAEMIYLDSAFGVRKGNCTWPTTVLALEPTVENVIEALKTGPYGRCVYRCDNNVVDHQVVNMQFEDGATADFTMCAFTSEGGREIKVMGTLGDIAADMNTNQVVITEFGKVRETFDINKLTDDLSGHAGGDNRMLSDFFETVQNNTTKGTSLTSVDVSVESHIMALAAERSRKNNGRCVSLSEIYKEVQE